MESKPNPGDKVEIKTKEKTILGALMPEHADTIVLKLDSGYNIGIDKKNIISIKIVEAKKDKTKMPAKEKTQSTTKITHVQNNNLPKISILHTGGTIASKIDYETGGVIARFSPEELTAMFPELKGIANINSRLIRNMFSDDMRFAHYNILTKEIESEIKNGAQGIIITHGTDTLHYTSAALSFTLENLSVPVILVGAQRSSDRPSSDAAYNVISAAYLIANSKWHGVGIVMHENESDDNCVLIAGLNARKMHSSRRDAFKSINSSPIAKINFKQRRIEESKQQKTTTSKKEEASNKFSIKLFNENLRIAFVKSHPQMHVEEILAFSNFDGMILEGTGLGHLPVSKIDEFTDENEKILSAVKEVAKKIPIAITTQTIYGRVNLNVYANGRKIIEAGVLGNMCDMTPETAFIKLAWLLSNYPKDANKVKELYGKNLRGEISDRTDNKFDVF